MEFESLISYHCEANQDYIDTIVRSPDLPQRMRVLMSHILNAQAIWIDRSHGREPRYGVWQLHADEQLSDIQKAMEKEMRDFLRLDDLEEHISYQNSKGANFSNSKKDILFHIINHGTHHRGQIAMLMSSSGIVPPSNDYVIRIRENR